MLLQVLMILIRFWWRILCRISHSTSKLLNAPSSCKFKTFIETIIQFESVPLYTDPRLLLSSKLFALNPSVACISSWWEILLHGTRGDKSTSERNSAFLFWNLFQIATRATQIIVNQSTRNMYFSISVGVLFLGRGATSLHGGTCSHGAPQSASLDKNDAARKFINGPLVGISPRSLLKVTFKYLRYESVSKDLGISPDKLLWERSKKSKLINPPNDSGIVPSNWLSAKERLTKSLRPPIVVGILPDSWFLDKSNFFRTFKFPISNERKPLREFDDKLSTKRFLRLHKFKGIVEVN